jgi:hypothetical protein
MRISLLPETIRIDLSPVDAALWGGIVAIVRPVDVEEFSRWLDQFPGEDAARESAVILVKAQLLRMEGADVEGVPFDPKDPKHFRSVFSLKRKGVAGVLLIYNELLSRARVDGDAEKNSDSPSGLDTTSSSAD